jgi:hypothetical protein
MRVAMTAREETEMETSKQQEINDVRNTRTRNKLERAKMEVQCP